MKNTEVTFVKISSILNDNFQNGLYKPSKDYGSGVPIIRIVDFNNEGEFSYSSLSRVNINSQELNTYQLREKDILINRVNSLSHVGKSVIINKLPEPTVYESNMMRLRISEDARIFPEFLIYFLQSMWVRNNLLRVAKRAVAQSSINQDDIGSLTIPLYSKTEQINIIQILSYWDTAISLTKRLIVAKNRYLEYLASILINKSDYSCEKLKVIIKESSIRNSTNACQRVLSITNNSGFILPENQFERRIASENISKYKLICRGQYAYNPSRINVGSIARLDDWDEGILSPMYIAFTLDDNRVNSDYFLHWLSSYTAKEHIKRAAQGSVRETVSFEDFGNIMIPLPPKESQNKVVSILNSADKEISLLNKELEAYRKQKHGLLKKLFTGEWRTDNAKDF